MKRNSKTGIVLAAMILVSSVVFAACSKKTEITPNQQITTKSWDEIEAIKNEILEATTGVVTGVQTEPQHAASIHDEYDLLLCKGTSDNGDIYCLVANEHEDYTGTQIEIGVIKNNKWLIEPTTDNPFIGDDGLFVNGEALRYFKENKGIIDYLGNGCFGFFRSWWYQECEVIVFNANTNKSYAASSYNYELKNGFVCDEGIFILTRQYIGHDPTECLLLDTNSMTVSTYKSPLPDTGEHHATNCIFHMYSDGLIYISKRYSDIRGFYDLKGNLIIDMSKYKVYENGKNHYTFKNGKCVLWVENDQGSIYEITIDKTGNVIASEKVS